jgi:hypothetical protein
MAKIALIAGGIALGAISGGILAVAAGHLVWAGVAEGALAGASIGDAAGRVLFPPHSNQSGPRLNDLTVSTSSDGAAIPFGYGTYRFGGNIIWSPGIKEHVTTSESGGKGGPSTTTTSYSYTASFAVAFGEGTGTIKKLWGDTKVLYDSAAPSKYPTPTLYSGTQTQGADPSIQADRGAANTPGFRHLIMAVFEDFPLADFGNRIPSIGAEVAFDINTLRGTVTDICARAGLDSSQIDVSLI